MGMITSAIDRALPVRNAARTTAVARTSEGTLATASGISALRRAGPSNAATYRNWAIHGELVRSALDINVGRLADAEWELVPFDNQGRPPDKGLMNRMREILAQPNPGEESLGTFLQAVGEDLWTLDAGPFEKERLMKGELAYLWPVDGAAIKIDRFWSGDPREARYFYTPRADIAIPLLNSDMGYLKMHNRSYSPLGIPPLETLKLTITAELNGSMYNDRQVTQAAPDGIMDLGENARPDQVETFKALWNSLIAGKSMMAFWGGTKSAKFIPFKGGNKEMQFMEWQEYCVRKLCAVMHLSPQDLGFSFDINKSTGEVQQAQTDDKGSFGLSRVQDVMTSQFCWDPYWGGIANNIAFRFTSISQRTSKAMAETHKLTLAGMPSQTINDARKDMGLPPIGDPAEESNPFNKLMANTPQGLVLLDKIPSAYDLAMRKTEPPDGGPPAGKPKQVAASIGPDELLTAMRTEMRAERASDMLQIASAIAGRPEGDHPVTVTIEKGAVDVDIDNHDGVAEAAELAVSTSQESAAQLVGEVRDAVKSMAEREAPVVNVPAPVVNVPPLEVPPATNVDMGPVVEAIQNLSKDMKKPRTEGPIIRREVIRDANGRVTEIIDHRED